MGLSLDSGEPYFSIYADDEWGTQFPSDGFVDVTVPVPDNDGRNRTRTFLVSMVHQMHCLDAFRVGFATNRTTESAHHVEHCLRYMLQLVLCHADATLERDEPGIRDGRWAHASSGVGAAHQCRDWRALWAWMEAQVRDA